MKLLSLTIPGQNGTGIPIDVPSGVPDPNYSLGDMLTFGISAMFVIAIILALFFLLWGGMSWILSGGDKEKLDKARRTLIFAVIGLIIVIFSFFIVAFVAESIGAKEILPEWARFLPGNSSNVPPGQNVPGSKF